jgi:TonB family protein
MKTESVVITLACLLVILFPAQAMTQPFDEPVVLRAVAPAFPVPSKASFAVGAVIVEVQINASGAVTKAHAIKGHPFLHATTEKAAQRWVFAPAAAEAKVRTVRLTFVFKMMEDARTPDEDVSPIFMPPFKIEVRRRVPVIETREP